jgi:hypothetical protein
VMNRLQARERQRVEFWHDHTELAALYRWLVDHDELEASDVGEVAYFLSKPWKWADSYKRMRGTDTELETRLQASLREVER